MDEENTQTNITASRGHFGTFNKHMLSRGEPTCMNDLKLSTHIELNYRYRSHKRTRVGGTAVIKLFPYINALGFFYKCT